MRVCAFMLVPSLKALFYHLQKGTIFPRDALVSVNGSSLEDKSIKEKQQLLVTAARSANRLNPAVLVFRPPPGEFNHEFGKGPIGLTMKSTADGVTVKSSAPGSQGK